MSFAALHLVTACHALRIVLLALGDPAAALRAFWPAWAGAWAMARSTRKAGTSGGEQQPAGWPSLIAIGRA